MKVIEVQGLHKSYADTKAVDGIDLTIAQGEIFALLGPNGAGKTTTVEILEGFRKADSGSISVLGFDPSQRGVQSRIWRNRIGVVLQSTADAGDLTVEETILHFAKYYSAPRDTDEVINDCLQIMHDYVTDNPSAISDPDFRDNMIEHTTEIMNIILENNILLDDEIEDDKLRMESIKLKLKSILEISKEELHDFYYKYFYNKNNNHIFIENFYNKPLETIFNKF